MLVLREKMLQEGMGSFRVRYLGDNQVLLSCQDGVKLPKVIKGNKERLFKIIEMLKPWDNGTIIGNKVV